MIIFYTKSIVGLAVSHLGKTIISPVIPGFLFHLYRLDANTELRTFLGIDHYVKRKNSPEFLLNCADAGA